MNDHSISKFVPLSVQRSLAVVAVAALILAAGCGSQMQEDARAAESGETATPASYPTTATPASYSPEVLQRGEYLVRIAGCDDCHTPLMMTENGPAPDMSRRFSGHPEGMELPPLQLPEGPWLWAGTATNTAFYGPWGTSFSTNLTPDENTGIGIWTEDIFMRTLKTGRHWGQARPILPPMPWQAYSQMTDEDLQAIYAYLRTVAPVKNRIPDAILAPVPAPTAAGG